MLCTHCGATLRQTARVCIQCGTAVPSAAEPTAPPLAPTATVSPPDPPVASVYEAAPAQPIGESATPSKLMAPAQHEVKTKSMWGWWLAGAALTVGGYLLVQVLGTPSFPSGGLTAPQVEEREAWEAAKRRDNADGYKAYLSAYPKGQYKNAAEIALWGLGEQVQAQGGTVSSAQAGQVFRDCEQEHCPEMVVIPAGTFTMGSGAAEQRLHHQEAAGSQKDWIDREGPQRQVSVGRFALGKYEVTQGQWRAVMGSNPSYFKDCGANCPVEQVSWNDIQQYLAKLNQLTGNRYGYRLASEAEWEYAARAGCGGAFNVGGQCWVKIEASEANFDGNSTYNGSARGVYRQKTVPVGSFAANGYGLHDMHGNVWEWVQDCFEANYSQGQPTDGSAHRGTDGSCSLRVLRGGSWYSIPKNLHSAGRNGYAPTNRGNNYGFRLARTVP